jgi:hypothetical protein
MQLNHAFRPVPFLALILSALVANGARAELLGVGPQTAFALTASDGRLPTPDGNSVYFWGFSIPPGLVQYPGPTLIVNQGDTISVSITNALPMGQRVSLVFPGQDGVTASCTAGSCIQGALTLEAGPGATVTYTFTAARAGTYHYSSGTQPELQIEMGLVGALIVRPIGFSSAAPQAYQSAGSEYEQEYLFLLSEMDSRIHDLVEQQGVAAAYASGYLADYFPNYWFINGRNAPDTMAEPGGNHLPNQPYNALVRTHPGDRVLMRVIGGGHDLHPFHHHGNHARIIARDGRVLDTEGDLAGDDDPLDLSHEVFTIQSVPGQTVDAIFTWTGKDLGWDIYGDPNQPPFDMVPLGDGTFVPHTCTAGANGLDPVTREYCADHGKPFPVFLPEQLSMTFGGYWPGSPFLGTLQLLPPGEGGMNPSAGYVHMWHSHTEKEIINFDVFPGGMMTMLIIEPANVPIP